MQAGSDTVACYDVPIPVKSVNKKGATQQFPVRAV